MAPKRQPGKRAKSPAKRPSQLTPAKPSIVKTSRAGLIIAAVVLAIGIIGYTVSQTSSANSGTPVYGYEIVNRYPHNLRSFTQGLQYLDGTLYEGTGQNGASGVMKEDLESGEILQRQSIPDQYFGEGIVVVDDKLYELTWQSEAGFVYDRETLRPLRQFHYPGEGWGLTYDGDRIIMSDGSEFLRFWDPETLEETGRIQVTDNSVPIRNLNELEYIDGEVYANVWTTDRIARIDPESGKVNSWIDLRGLLPASESQGADVLNGIAWDARGKRLFVTGKWWPRLFEIRLVEKN